MITAPGAATTAPRRRRSVVLFFVGLILAGAAIWFALGGGPGADSLQTAWSNARKAPPALAGAIFVLPALNWLLTSAYFLVLTRRYGAVGAAEMGSLVGASWLLNYAPLKPGLLGRVAYHKAVNAIAIADSVRVLASAIGAGICAVLVLLLIAAVTPRTAPVAYGVGAILTPGVACAFGAWVLRDKGHAWRIPAALGLRYADALVWAARYFVIFAAIDQPVTAVQAAAIAGVSQLVLVIPFSGNGLGIREWAVGLTAATLPGWFASPLTADAAGTGIAADLLNRLAELCVAIVVGVPCVLAVSRRLRSVRHPAGGVNAGAPQPPVR